MFMRTYVLPPELTTVISKSMCVLIFNNERFIIVWCCNTTAVYISIAMNTAYLIYHYWVHQTGLTALNCLLSICYYLNVR
jgi:hypothetical protein